MTYTCFQILKTVKGDLNNNGLGKRFDQSSLKGTALILKSIPENE